MNIHDESNREVLNNFLMFIRSDMRPHVLKAAQSHKNIQTLEKSKIVKDAIALSKKQNGKLPPLPPEYK